MPVYIVENSNLGRNYHIPPGLSKTMAERLTLRSIRQQKKHEQCVVSWHYLSLDHTTSLRVGYGI